MKRKTTKTTKTVTTNPLLICEKCKETSVDINLSKNDYGYERLCWECYREVLKELKK